MKNIVFVCILLVAFSSFGQKKVLDHADFEIWNTIKNRTISTNGEYIMYSLERGEADHFLKLKDASSTLILEHDRAKNGQFTFDSKYALFTIKAWQDSVRDMKRRKVKKENLPKDTLGIYMIKDKSIIKIPGVKSYKMPEKWSGFIAYQLEDIKLEKVTEADSTSTEVQQEPSSKTKKNTPRKVNVENGYHLVIRNLATAKQDTIKYVTNYLFAKEGKRLAFTTSGMDTTTEASVNVFNLENSQINNLFTSTKGKYSQLAFSESGKKIGFIADLDTTKAQIRPNELYFWEEGKQNAERLVDRESSPTNYMVSADGVISFSKDESKMYFGLATIPIVPDTTLLAEEIVNVEVWTYNEPRLYTVQEAEKERDQKKAYTSVIHLNDANKLIQIATIEFPNAELGNEGNAEYALVNTQTPYQLTSQWDGLWSRDYAIVNLLTGDTKQIISNISGNVNLSPKGNYVYGYNMVDSTWFTYVISSGNLTNLTKNRVFYDELNDSPKLPSPYGAAGWTKNDASIILYDRYDLWEFNPRTGSSKQITSGRSKKTVFRYLRLDPEERFIDSKSKWLLSTFNDLNRNAGFYSMNYTKGKGNQLIEGSYLFSRPIKAKNKDKIIFSKESFQEFPNIYSSNLSLSKPTQISDANPQQVDYKWGSSEIVKWTSLDGIELEGMLIKPENFDPTKKYPMIVNFYERSSNRVNRHLTPIPGRSTINYSFYASRGYIIFNPDIKYRQGYPGESAYNCLIPGVTALIEKGFVDKDHIGLQGHSWGGYQIAYLVTRSDLFKAAEAGAPVPNMISAYGGIRWETGLSRQFQYEHTQSRIGGTPWEYPARYIENSPIFFVDKINTPLLIMHNDSDGHVPWYQGIELFVSLRRLGKPSWFLSYNNEPHWPLKLQNRKDFNIRLAQFFDYYLKDAQKPVWMDRGVPAIEKGINQGYELIEK